MPISRYQATSALARPGVIPNAAARPASPYEGQFVYQTDTDGLFVWNGSAWDIVINAAKTFIDEAARDAAIPTPYEGLEVYLTSPTGVSATGETTFIPAGIKTVYNGSNWVCITPVSARTSTAGTVDVNPWAALTGGGTAPTVTLQTGTKALVTINTVVTPSVTSTQVWYVGVSISGATTRSVDGWAYIGRPSSVAFAEQSGSASFVITGLTPGANTFGLLYGRVNVSGAVQFSNRIITAVGLL